MVSNSKVRSILHLCNLESDSFNWWVCFGTQTRIELTRTQAVDHCPNAARWLAMQLTKLYSHWLLRRAYVHGRSIQSLRLNITSLKFPTMQWKWGSHVRIAHGFQVTLRSMPEGSPRTLATQYLWIKNNLLATLLNFLIIMHAFSTAGITVPKAKQFWYKLDSKVLSAITITLKKTRMKHH